MLIYTQFSFSKLDPRLSPEADFGPLKTNEMPLSSHAQSLRDMYRETKELLHQQDLIRQSMQEQLGLVLSISVPQQQHSPGSQTPSIWLHDTESNIQERGDLHPDCRVPMNTPLLSPVSDSQRSLLQSERGTRGSDLDSITISHQTHLDRDVHQRAHSPETQIHISSEWSPDSLMMNETDERAGDLEGDNLNCCKSLRCVEEHMVPGQAMVRRLSQEVVLLASQNEALNQRNQEMLNQLTEADRELERLKAELVSRHPGDPHHLSEVDQLNQTRAECLERELSKRNQQLQEAQSLVTSLEERLRDTETQLQLREATLQGLGVPADTEEEGDENIDMLHYEKRAEGYLLRCFEATETKLTELERQLHQSELACRELQAHNVELREVEKLYSQRATEAEADIRRLNEELESERLKEGENKGDKLPDSSTSVSGDEKIQQVIEGVIMRFNALGKLLEVIDMSDYRMIKGSIENEHEQEKPTTVVSQLKWEQEFWEAMLKGLKADPSQLNEEKLMDTLLSEVAEHMIVEKQVFLLAHDLFSETDSCREIGRGGQEGSCKSRSLKDLDIVGNTASEAEPENKENGDDNRGILDLNHQHSDTDKNISRHFTELTQMKMSLLNHIASSVRASADENLQSMAYRLCDFHSSEHPWLNLIHSAAIETLYSYHISRLHSSYQTELKETKQRLLTSSLICGNCTGLMDENKELRTRLSDLEKQRSASGEAEISTLSQIEDTDNELWDRTDKQRVDNTAESVTGKMEESPEQESTAEEEVQNLETPEEVVEDYSSPDSMEIPDLSDKGHRGIQEKISVENIEIIDEDHEETYSHGLEDVVLLRGRVKDLEEQLSAIAEEMKVELDGTITSLQVQHETDMKKFKVGVIIFIWISLINATNENY